jgi:hypothetical protein
VNEALGNLFPKSMASHPFLIQWTCMNLATPFLSPP